MSRARHLIRPIWLGLLLAAVILPWPAGAQQIVADLSKRLVAITTGFVGSDVLLFGAIEGDGDIVVIVRGPDRPVTVREKNRVSGIWINTNSVTYRNVPTFYALAANRPLADFVPTALAQRHQIGPDFLRVQPNVTLAADRADTFRRSLVRLKQREGLFQPDVARITFLENFKGPRLFRATINFPSNVQTGNYSVQVLLIRGGNVVSAQSSALAVSKIGVGAEVYEFAQRDAWLYGLIAVLTAMLIGVGAARMFRQP